MHLKSEWSDLLSSAICLVSGKNNIHSLYMLKIKTSHISAFCRVTLTDRKSPAGGGGGI